MQARGLSLMHTFDSPFTYISDPYYHIVAAHSLRLEADPETCSLDLMLLVETVAEPNMQWMLPINVLRNYAMLATRSRLVAMVDVDLVPSVGLSQWLLQPGK